MNWVGKLFGEGALLRFWIALGACFCLVWSPAAQAHRAALIIGNGDYLNAPTLANPVADAQIVAASAKRAGFDVTMATNLSKAAFDQALRDFRQSADGAEVAMVYFAGHGIESGDKNWLLPVDAKLAESRDLRFEALELDSLLETLDGAQLRIVVIDACRNNPFGNSWRSGTRSVASGLSEQEVEGALVIYAAAGGQVALDGGSQNSPFAQSLAARLSEPGLTIHRLGSAILDDVAKATGGQQRPWTNMSIPSREFFLVDKPQSAALTPAAAPASSGPISTGTSDRTTAEVLMWQGADRAGTAEAYESFLGVFPNGLFANMAKDRLAGLRGPQPAAPARPAPEPAPAPYVAPVAPLPVAPVVRTAPPPQPVAPLPAPAAMPVASPVAAPAQIVSVAPRFPTTFSPAAPINLAAFKLEKDGAALPSIPGSPLFPEDGYPNCREAYQQVTDPIARINTINQCMGQLDRYVEVVLNGFSRAMIEHQDEISRMYSEQVGGKPMFSPESQNVFYDAMMKEHAASNPGGAHFAAHAAAKRRYEEDRRYLQDRYCFSSGTCGGYAAPPGVAPTPTQGQ